MAWALGKLSHHHQGLLDAMAEQATHMVKVSPTLFTAIWLDRWQPWQIHAPVTQHVPVYLPQCERWVVTKGHSTHVWMRIGQATWWGVQELSLQHISNILWAYASFLCVGRPMAAAFLQELRARLRTAAFNAQQASNLLWSLCIAGVGAPHPQLQLTHVCQNLELHVHPALSSDACLNATSS